MFLFSVIQRHERLRVFECEIFCKRKKCYVLVASVLLSDILYSLVEMESLDRIDLIMM